MFIRIHSIRSRRPAPLTALWSIFFLNGSVLASWAPRIPEVQKTLALSDATLGAALFGVAAGSLPSLLAAERLLRVLESRTVCLVAAGLFAGGLPLIAAATGPITLGLALAALGSASGALDVAMNTAGVRLQHDSGRPVLSRLHGGYSLGVLTGAAGGAAAAYGDVSLLTHLVAVAVTLVLLLALCGPALPGDRARTVADPPTRRRGWMRSLTVPIGGVAIAALLAEGLATDWSAVLLTRDRGAGGFTGATAVVAFSVAMFVSRTGGDYFLTRVGRIHYLAAAATVLAAGAACVLVGPGWAAPYAGIVAMGLALGPVFPLAVTLAAERSPQAAASATAAVSTVGYSAHLAGPPAIGVVAEGAGLPATFAFFDAACAVVIAICAIALQKNPPVARSAGRPRIFR